MAQIGGIYKAWVVRLLVLDWECRVVVWERRELVEDGMLG